MDFRRKKPSSKVEQGSRAELKIAQHVRRTYRSGAGSWKGDIHSMDDVIEVKHTTANSYSISLRVWGKIAREALRRGREASLVIEFEEGPTLLVTELSLV